MTSYNMYEAKTHFSEIVNAAISGKEIIIAKAGKPVAKVVPILKRRPKRPLGVLKGKFKIPKDFDDELPDDEIALFERD